MQGWKEDARVERKSSELFIIIKAVDPSKWTYELVKKNNRNEPNAKILTQHFNGPMLNDDFTR